MKLPILGIILVIFLQLGFTAYNVLNRPMDSLVDVNEVINGANPLANDLENSSGDVFLTRDAAHISYRVGTKSNPSSVAPRTDKKKAKSGSVSLTPRVAVSRKSLESVTITYWKPSSESGETEDDLLTAGLETKPEKKSFAAKSVSVIKKPYDWIKALGSKIN